MFTSRMQPNDPTKTYYALLFHCLSVDYEYISASKSSIRRFIITEKAPTRAFSWLKAATTAFTFKTLLRHYAKRSLTPQSLNVKLGPRRNYHKGRDLLRDCTLYSFTDGSICGTNYIPTERLPLSKQCDTETHWASDWQSPSQNLPAESLMSASTTVTSNINATTNNFILSRMSRTC